MLSLPAELIAEIVAHAQAEHPIECCGVVTRPTGQSGPLSLVKLRNVAASEDFYEIDSASLFRLYAELDKNRHEIYVVYHSHTHSPAFPSETDIRLASEPRALYLLVSTATAEPEVRAFLIEESGVLEQPLNVSAPGYS